MENKSKIIEIWCDYERTVGPALDVHGYVPDDKTKEFHLEKMIALAAGLRKMTGLDIQYHYVLSNDNPFGDWGFFVLWAKKPWYKILWHRIKQLPRK